MRGLIIPRFADVCNEKNGHDSKPKRVVQKLLREHGVKNWFSLQYMPSYSGSIEAGIGSLTSRTEQFAARRQQAVVPDLDEAVRQHLLHKTTQELLDCLCPAG